MTPRLECLRFYFSLGYQNTLGEAPSAL
uniref:Uncharacterized protein n=1 Tax=Arundo donax TaxID=35708 RepID=A0A0A9ASQ2_ARUDO